MKIYCELCKKVQPVQIDNGIDVKSKKPYQDIVCGECNLVIASGTDIAPPKWEWVGLTEQERNDLEDYCEMIVGKAAFNAIETKLKEKNT